MPLDQVVGRHQQTGGAEAALDGARVEERLLDRVQRVGAGQAEGARIGTVEGMATEEALHPVQQAFLDAGAVQCGFCTPGLLVATDDLVTRSLAAGGPPEDAEIREALAGNLCRCTGYEKVLDAVRLAADRMAGDPTEAAR